MTISEKRYAILGAAFLTGFIACGAARAADPDALWKIVHDKCVPAVEAGNGTGPCAAVDLERRVAVLKDINGANQFLLIPTDRVAGIETPSILDPGAPNYWAAAWQARSFMIAKAGKTVPRDEISLAINSPHGRSQNQLHIHIDCIAPEVLETLRASAPALTANWAPLAAALHGHHYRARRLDGEDLTANLFTVLAEDGDAAMHMPDETLVVVAWDFADGKPGFILLADRADLVAGDPASGEELQDHACAVLR
jgi:CDP-diacylglycerol pyrophosphatase